MVATLEQVQTAMANEGFYIAETLDEIADYPAMLFDYGEGDTAEDNSQEDALVLIAVVAPAGELPSLAMKDGVRRWLRGDTGATSVAQLRAHPGAPDESAGVGIEALRSPLRMIPTGGISEVDIAALPDTMRDEDDEEDTEPTEFPAALAYTRTLRML